CGYYQTLNDDPSVVCLGYPDPITGTSTEVGTTSTTSTTTATTTTVETEGTVDGSTGSESEESTTGTTSGCRSDNECGGDAPSCDLTLAECVPCSGAEGPDAACAAFDPTAPVCFGDA